MRAVLLDQASLHPQDLDFTCLQQLPIQWTFHPHTEQSQTAARIQDQDIVVVNKVLLDKSTLSNAQALRYISIAATGTNNVDLSAAQALGIQVSNVRGYGTPSVVQHVFGLILALTTRLLDYHGAVQSGRWRAAADFCLLDYPIRELSGKTLGIVGYGQLGQGVAQVAQAFGMRVLIAQRPGQSQPSADRLPLTTMLPQVDVLTLHVPLTPQTQQLIGHDELGLMKPTALLINTARGGIVDEQALAHALQEARIGGAGFDVLSEEPPRSANPLLDMALPNLIITPHTAWASREARQRILDQTSTNLQAFLSGSPTQLVT